MKVGAHIVVDSADGVSSCAECGEDFGPVDQNLKQFLVVNERSIEDAGPYYGDPSRFVSDEIVFREYYCPGCGTRLFAKAAQPDDAPLSEVELASESL